MKKILVSVLALVVLAGCSTPAPVATPNATITPEATQMPSAEAIVSAEVTCSQISEDVVSETIFTVDAGEITRVTIFQAYSITSEEQEKGITALLEESKTKYTDVEGIIFDYKKVETTLEATASYDVTLLDATTLESIGFSEEMKTDGKFAPEKFIEIATAADVACIVE